MVQVTDYEQVSTHSGKISSFWLIFPSLPVSAYNLPAFDKVSDAPRQNPIFETFSNTPISRRS